MAGSIHELRVRLAPDGFYPQAFRWAGRDIRVVAVDGLRTCRTERRFRVRTLEGMYELTQEMRSLRWRMRRSPTWFARAAAQLSLEPRYSLPVGERRAARRGRVRGSGGLPA